jgi:membrane fusion protein (multidrug efflux system)
MKAFKTITIVLLAIGLFVGLKFLFFPVEKNKMAAPSPDAKTPPTPVTVYVAGTSALGDKLMATGTIIANEEAELKPEMNGRIVHLFLPEGQLVNQGTLLVKINDNDLKAQLEKIKSQLRFAHATEARLKRLLQMEGASQQEYDQAISALHTLKADSTYYLAQIAKTEIRAPFTGFVGIRSVSPGSYVTTATTVAHIQQINPVKIDFSLPEKYASLLNRGESISFHSETNQDLLQATIVVKDPKIDANNRTVHFRAICANPKGNLLPGAFVHIELLLTDKKESIYIPTEAIIPTLKGKKVFVVKNGMAQERIVSDGMRTSDKIQINQGLEQGDSVVVTGNMQLKTGDPVRVIAPNKLAN